MPFLKEKLKTYRLQIFSGQFFKLIEAVLELFIPIAMAKLIDVGVKNGDSAYILSKAGQMLLLAFIGLLCALICQYIATKVSFAFGSELRRELFEKANALSAKERNAFGVASLSNRISNDVNHLQDAVAMLIRLVVRAPFLMLGSIVMAMSLQFSLSLVFIVTAPAIAYAMYSVLKGIAPGYKTLQKILDGMHQRTLETLQGSRVIRALSRQKFMQDKFQKQTDDYTRQALQIGKISSVLSPLTSVIMNFGIVFVLLMGAGKVQAGAVKIGVIIAFIQYLAQILLQTTVVANLVILFTKAFASAGRVEEVSRSLSSVPDVKWTEEDFSDFASLRFESVSLSYNPGINALHNVSFTLKKGESLGIIGGTGAGKTGIARLMLRLYEKTAGEIYFNESPIDRVPLAKLREKISIAFQEHSFISASVRENLAMDRAIGDAELLHALKIADAMFVLDKENGLDERILEGASNFSGGQKQRLAIARAYLQGSDIVIFDDSFSALDFATEKKVRDALNGHQENRAYVFISQRISGVKYADHILVMDHGKVVDEGTHESLLASSSIYREIYASQSMEEAL